MRRAGCTMMRQSPLFQGRFLHAQERFLHAAAQLVHTTPMVRHQVSEGVRWPMYSLTPAECSTSPSSAATRRSTVARSARGLWSPGKCRCRFVHAGSGGKGMKVRREGREGRTCSPLESPAGEGGPPHAQAHYESYMGLWHLPAVPGMNGALD